MAQALLHLCLVPKLGAWGLIPGNRAVRPTICAEAETAAAAEERARGAEAEQVGLKARPCGKRSLEKLGHALLHGSEAAC